MRNATSDSPSHATATNTPSTIMVVDDDPIQRLLLDGMLKASGFRTEIVDSGEMALQMLDEVAVDAVVLDEVMPEISGIDVLHLLRDSGNAIPVLMVTGSGELHEKVAGLEAGADDYLTKPVDSSELFARIRAVLRTRSRIIVGVSEDAGRRRALLTAIQGVDTEARPAHVIADACQRLSAVSTVRRCAVFSFGEAGTTISAAAGFEDTSWLSGNELPDSLDKLLRDRILLGSWTEPGYGLLGDLWSPTRDADLVLAPMSNDGTPIGVLAMEVEHGHGAGVEGATLDLATDLATFIGPYATAANGTIDDERSVRDAVQNDQFEIHFQPVVDLRSGEVVGYEALARFNSGIAPDIMIHRAHQAGLGRELEIALIARAIQEATALKDGTVLHLNLSPALLSDSKLSSILAAADRRVVLEVTEHEPIDDYGQARSLLDALGPNVSLAIDDAGAGWASLRHVVDLNPDIVKLDRTWVAGVDADPKRQHLIGMLVDLAHKLGATVVAEGIEYESELETLINLGVEMGQGYFLGGPALAKANVA